jgi:hypothetical protein
VRYIYVTNSRRVLTFFFLIFNTFSEIYRFFADISPPNRKKIHRASPPHAASSTARRAERKEKASLAYRQKRNTQGSDFDYFLLNFIALHSAPYGKITPNSAIMQSLVVIIGKNQPR